jgi:hypothetical protein
MKMQVYWKDLKDERLREMTPAALALKFGGNPRNWGRLKAGTAAGGWYKDFITRVNEHGVSALAFFSQRELQRNGKQNQLDYLPLNKRGKPLYGNMVSSPEWCQQFRY